MQEVASKTAEKWLTEAMNSRLPERFGDVYDYFVPRMYRHILYRVGNRDTAEELAAEAFLRAWDYLATSPNPIENAKAFLFRIAQNLVTDYYRKRSREAMSLEDVPETHVPFVEPGFLSRLEAEHLRAHVRDALQDLDEEYRDIVVWRYIDELSIEEIVEISGKSSNAIYVTIHRALKKLRVSLGARGFRDI